MTGLVGNWQIYLPERFRITSQRVSIDQGAAEVDRNFWEGDPESQSSNRSAYYPSDQSIFFYYTIMLREHSKRKNDYFN